MKTRTRLEDLDNAGNLDKISCIGQIFQARAPKLQTSTGIYKQNLDKGK